MPIMKRSKLNKIFVSIIMMVLLLCCSSQIEAAQDGGNVDYLSTTQDGKVSIDKYIGDGGAVTIPGTLNGAVVTRIGDGAFWRCDKVGSIIIPQSVTSIGDSAFFGCVYLTSVSIPEGVTSIGDLAFANSGLGSVTIPKSVTEVGRAAFYWCKGLPSITFNSPTTAIYFSPDTIPDTTKIIGYDPSTAKTYAKQYNRKFQAIGTTTISNTPMILAVSVLIFLGLATLWRRKLAMARQKENDLLMSSTIISKDIIEK